MLIKKNNGGLTTVSEMKRNAVLRLYTQYALILQS